MTEKEVREVIIATINELKRNGLLRGVDENAYSDVSELLKAYYDGGERDTAVKQAISSLDGDKYARIIPLYYGYGYTIEQLAEILDIEASTVTRNKKRLCLKLYDLIDRSN